MVRTASFAALVSLAVCAAGCAAPPAAPVAADAKAMPVLDAAGADCTGHIQFESTHFGAGRSACRKGSGLSFSAYTEDAVAAGLACDYSLTYASSASGQGNLVCNDGSSGTLTFREIDLRNGVAIAKLQDGRQIRFTYSAHRPVGEEV